MSRLFPIAMRHSPIVDLTPTLLSTYFRRHAISVRCDFRITKYSSPFLLYSSWLAASVGGVLPISNRHILRNGPQLILISPPWPLDFRLHIHTYTQSDADTVIDILSGQ